MPKPDADPHGGVEDFKNLEDPNKLFDNSDKTSSNIEDEINYH